VFNHNLKPVRELYANVRPGADYDWSLQLLQQFKAATRAAHQVRHHAGLARREHRSRRCGIYAPITST
jgi:lipoate synthase